MKKNILATAIYVVLLLVLSACSHNVSEESGNNEHDMMSGYRWFASSVDQLVSWSTDIIRVEILDSRAEMINIGSTEPEIINHLVHRLRVLEVFYGEAQVGEILEIAQIDVQLGEHWLYDVPPQYFVYGEEIIFFAQNFNNTDIGSRPMILVCPGQSEYRVRASGEIGASEFIGGIVATYDANPEIADFTFENQNLWSTITLTVGDLILIRYEAGLGPRPYNLQPPVGVDRSRLNESIARAEYYLPQNYMLPGWDNVQYLLDVAIHVRDNPYSRQIHINPASSRLRHAMLFLGIDTSAPVPTPPSNVTPSPTPAGNPTQTGTIGTTQTAAPWRLYPDGTLVIAPGTITWPAAQSPWHNYRSYILRVIIEGPITAGPSIRGLFAHLPYVTEIIDLHYFDTSGVTNMNSMFNGSESLAYLDVSSWDTSNVTSMAAMFNSISATSLDVSNWDTSQVTTMNRMFQYATNLTTLDVSSWDTSNVTDMEALFHDTAITSLDVSNWNTSNVTSMNRLFQRTPNLATLDVSSWNTGKVTDMTGMFDGASSLTAIDVSNWDTSNVVQMRRLFSGTTNVTALDVSNWNTSSATNMEGMFINTGATNLDLSRWSTSNVTTMANMFNGAAGIVTLDLSNFDTRNVTSMNRMFQNMTNLSTLDISGWNTSNVTDMFQMFGRADALRQISLGEDFRFVTDGGVLLLRSGIWRNMGSVGNTATTPAGTYVLTTAELIAHHNANPTLDTWVMD